jgi:hypothetical protein
MHIIIVMKEKKKEKKKGYGTLHKAALSFTNSNG